VLEGQLAEALAGLLDVASVGGFVVQGESAASDVEGGEVVAIAGDVAADVQGPGLGEDASGGLVEDPLGPDGTGRKTGGPADA
jgi:hypothetical protein